MSVAVARPGMSPAPVAAVASAATDLCRVLASFDPAAFSPADCFALAALLAKTEKACGAARVLAAARAGSAGAPRSAGYRDAADWMAQQTGTTTARAREDLRTAAGLDGCAETRRALIAGEISLAQAGEIARHQAEAPGSEADLLAAARSGDLGHVREEARRRFQRSHSPEELRRRHFADRRLRLWQDSTGMVCLQGALPPEWGVPLRNRLDRDARRLYRQAKHAGEALAPFEAYTADALVAALGRPGTRPAGTPGGPPERHPEVVAGDGGPGAARHPSTLAEPGTGRQTPGLPEAKAAFHADLVIVCDLMAFRRGYAEPGEVCQIIGAGPVPVEVARDWAEDAFVKAALHDGVAIHTICHFGRHIPAALRTALELGPVPEFTGPACRNCGRSFALETDHIKPVANRGPTAIANLQPLCWHCHRSKTAQDRIAGFHHPPGPPP